jgi:hypothetical protein
MLSANPRASDPATTYDLPGDAPQLLDAPEYLVQRYLDLTAQRRALEEQIAVIRAELEILAVSSLSDERPRGRFAATNGQVTVRLQPTCVFERGEVARALQRAGKLAEVAVLPGPSVARFLAGDPALAARLGEMIRYRKAVVLTANPA